MTIRSHTVFAAALLALSAAALRVANSPSAARVWFSAPAVQASLAISSRADAEGKTFHLVASRPPTIGSLIEAAREERPSLPPIAFEATNGDARRDAEPGVKPAPAHPLLVYLNCRLHFDVTNTMAALRGTGIEPPVTDYNFLRRQVLLAGRQILDRGRARVAAASEARHCVPPQ